MNDLKKYFLENEKNLIDKWMHYFEVYDHHFAKFRNTDVCILEIGVQNGGSLQMWREYFGPKAKICGMDIDPTCKKMEKEGFEIFIGDQENREFLNEVKESIPQIDILIDDGGHCMGQQITTFQELFPHVNENGVYLCEDLHTSYWPKFGGGYRNPNSFIEYMKSIVDHINGSSFEISPASNHRPIPFVTYLTGTVRSLNFYKDIVVIEKRSNDGIWSRKTTGKIKL